MKKIYMLLIFVVMVSSCVRSRYYLFQIQEIGATLVLEENNSNTQRVFLCNEYDVTDYEYLLSHSTELIANKNANNALEVGVFSTPSDAGKALVFFNLRNGLQLIPYNSFVLKETQGIRTLNDQKYVMLTIPLDNHDVLFYRHNGVEATSCHAQDSTVMVETIFNRHVQDRGASRRYLFELPSFFTIERLSDCHHQINPEPLKDGNGFKYCGTQVEIDVPSGEWSEVSFYINPSLPTYLFNDHINYKDKGTVRISSQEVVLVETDMYLGSPGIRVVANKRGISIKQQE